MTDKEFIYNPMDYTAQYPETSAGDDMLDGGEFDDVVVTGQDLRWKKWAVALGAVALVWLLAVQE